MIAALALLALVSAPAAGEDSLARGRALLDARRPAEAEPILRKAVEADPGDPRASYYLAVALLRQGGDARRAEAIALLESARLLSGSRPSPAVLVELGKAYAAAGRLEKAQGVLEEAVALAPRHPALLLELGWIYYRRLEGEKAEATFERAWAIAPSGIAALYLGLARAALGKNAAAMESFREATRLEPTLVEAHLGLGRTLVQAGRSEEARAAFRRALELRPGDADAHDQLGLLDLQEGRLDEAAAHFEAAVASDPGHRQGWYHLWQVSLRRGATERAAVARARFEALPAEPDARARSTSARSRPER